MTTRWCAMYSMHYAHNNICRSVEWEESPGTSGYLHCISFRALNIEYVYHSSWSNECIEMDGTSLGSICIQYSLEPFPIWVDLIMRCCLNTNGNVSFFFLPRFQEICDSVNGNDKSAFKVFFLLWKNYYLFPDIIYLHSCIVCSYSEHSHNAHNISYDSGQEFAFNFMTFFSPCISVCFCS